MLGDEVEFENNNSDEGENEERGEEEISSTTDRKSKISERAIKEVARIINAGVPLPTVAAHYQLSDRVDLVITKDQISDVALTLVRGGNVFSIGLQTWMDLYPKMRSIHTAIMKRFKNILQKIDADERNGHDIFQLPNGQFIRVRFMNEISQVHFCDKNLVVLFQLLLNEWRELFKNLNEINILIQTKYLNYATKLSNY